MTKNILGIALMAAATLTMTGCRTAPGPNYALSIRDKPSADDVYKANACRKCLPSVLSLSTNQVLVEPGPGFTYVTVSNTQVSVFETGVISHLATFNANNPNHPAHIEVK
jgi:hypothetical protein